MAMTTRAKIILAGLAAAAVVGSYMLVDRYAGVGNISQGVSQSARSVFVQDLGQKAQGLEAEIEKAEGAEGTEQYNPQLVSLLNRLYSAVPEENRLALTTETLYGLPSGKKVEVVTGMIRQDYSVVSPLVRSAADRQLLSQSDVTYVGRTALGAMDEQQRQGVVSDVVASFPYTTTSQLTMSGLNGLNNADLFRAMSVTTGKIGERFKDSVGERFGSIFKLLP